MCVGLRGLVYTEIEARGAERKIFIPECMEERRRTLFSTLIELLAKMKDSNGVIQIPGIYDDVEPPAPAEMRSWEALPFSEDEFLKNEVGSSRLTGEPNYSVLERVWARSPLEVHGIAGGFTAAGARR